jgi:hypothetical protein
MFFQPQSVPSPVKKQVYWLLGNLELSCLVKRRGGRRPTLFRTAIKLPLKMMYLSSLVRSPSSFFPSLPPLCKWHEIDHSEIKVLTCIASRVSFESGLTFLVADTDRRTFAWKKFKYSHN